MRNSPTLCLASFLLLAGTFASAADSGSTFAHIARPHPRADGAPKASDVCFSSRWPRPMNRADKLDSLKSAREFHATRMDWLYLSLSGTPESGKAFVAKCKAAGYVVGGTLNCQPTDSPAGPARTFSNARTVNMKGEPQKDPWTKSYGGRFCCPNNPEYATIFLAHARHALEAGVDYFQMDGVQLNDLMTHYGGCFCAHCVKGFRGYLAAHSTRSQRARWGVGDLAAFDYARFLLGLGTDPDAGLNAWKGPKELRELFRAFQIESGLRFLREMHREIDRIAGRKLAYSCNATEEFLVDYHKIHDFAFNETYPAKEGDPAFLYERRLKPAQKLGKPFLMTFVSDDVPHNRRFIASAYALGANVVVPWDVFIGLNSPRFFGTPEQFSDLFGFVRANAALLDGYEDAGVFGAGIRDTRFSEKEPPLQVYAASDVLAVVRAKPGQSGAPVVVHLVGAKNNQTGPMRVTFDPRRFFGGRPLKLRFLAPAPYEAAAHEKAEASRDFAALSMTTELPGGRVCVAELPGVDPWGILVIEPASDKVTTPWQPAVWCDEKSRFGESLQVRLACTTRGAQIRYTLDGSEPAKTAPLYKKPFQLDASTTIKAKAFGARGEASPVVTARFERAAARPQFAPDAETLKADLKLWLSAGTLAATLKDGAPVTKWPAVAGPAATVPTGKLLSGASPAAPTFVTALINGRPGVRFDGVDDQLTVAGFANTCLAGKPFTVFLVTQSDDTSFGVCGNAANGSGGIPRLYLTRGTFSYDRNTDSIPVGARPGTAAVTVYQHDGVKTASARSGGRATGKRDDLPVVKQFGGGNLAMSFWTGHNNHAGNLGEIIAYDRHLTAAEVEAIEEDLAARYGLNNRPRWH
jgi:hypothetical protein